MRARKGPLIAGTTSHRVGPESCAGVNRLINLRHVPAHAIPRDAAVYVAGHRGLVGSAIVRRLNAAGFTNVLSATRHQLDLRDQAAVNYWFKANRPEYVFLVAGTVGGILANSHAPGRVHLRQPDDPRHHRAREPGART